MIKLNLNKLFLKEANVIKQKTIQELLDTLRETTPVDTGRARDGWYFTGSSIRNDVEYIDELNQGTSRQAPAHFIEKAVLAQKGVIPLGVIVKTI
jgi:hypothetical protein